MHQEYREKTTLPTTQNQASKRKGSLYRRIKESGKKVGLAAVFEDTAKRGARPEEASIHTAEMTGIKTALKEIKKRREITGSYIQTPRALYRP